MFQFVIEPHNEHFVPLSHAFWALEVFVFRENYLFYILTNAALLAAVGMVWERWLRRLGVASAIAILTPLVALTCMAQADNVMAAWQSSILLSSLALVGALSVYRDGRLLQVAILCTCAALTFSAACVLPVMMAAYLAINYARARTARLLWAVAGFLALFAAFLKLSAWSTATNSRYLLAALWEGNNLVDKVRHLAWLGWYTTSISFYGPLCHLFPDRLPQQPSVVLTLLSLVPVGAALTLFWKSKRRSLLIELFVLQAALFALIGLFRHSPDYVGFAGRYYTFGLIPWLSAMAVASSDLLAGGRIPATWHKILLVLPLLLVARNVTFALMNDNWPLAHIGRASRLGYYATKDWLRRHQAEAVANIPFSQSAAPWLNLRMLLPVIDILDPSFVSHPRAIRDVSYMETLVNTRPWGTIVDGHPATQSFHVETPQLLTAVEFLVSRTPVLQHDVELSIEDDAGKVLWVADVPPDLWPANAWIAMPVDPVRLEPARNYLLKIASSTTNPDFAPYLWMNHHPGSVPYGGTLTRDGVVGDLCYRLSLMKP